jgi:putative restriction endonuclease
VEPLHSLLSNLTERHRNALQWFIDHAGEEHPWPKPIFGLSERTLLASKAKGIYKPTWSRYALSVRQSLGSSYPDREPIIRTDGTWFFSYFQENEALFARDSEYTNRGLLECLRDRVPVGVMRQTSQRPTVRYKIWGVASVAGWDGGYFFLEGFNPDGYARGRGPNGEIEFLADKQTLIGLENGEFDPTNVIDGRERCIAQIIRRRGQPQFRQKLLEIYEGRCAISECDAIDALEAAHISPYRGPETNHPTNGLLLRADLHTLFDLGLLAIDCASLAVILHKTLINSQYRELADRRLRLPAHPKLRPNLEALKLHHEWSGL